MALAGAAAALDPVPPVGGNVRRKRVRVEEVPLVEQPVPVALCGFPKPSKHGAAVPCPQFAAYCGYPNHKRWREENEPAPVLSEPAISEASAPPTKLNTHVFFAD